MSNILQLLDLEPSPQSLDYVENKKQFHLFKLLTEQRHPRTWKLSFVAQSDVASALRDLLAVDEDISRRLAELSRDAGVLEQAAAAAAEAVLTGHKIYFYGCGATGRLAKQMESSLWRPFWAKVKNSASWEKLCLRLPGDIGERCVGEMTGGDRALVSSLEGFEDLQLIGKLQLQDRGIKKGDVVFCVTEGGETSSVIGTILAALEQYGAWDDETVREARRRLYFVYNNPDDVLRPFARSMQVLESPAITRINLATGPQAITGSTRMQATTSETFVLGVVLEDAIGRILSACLTPEELRVLGYDGNSSLSDKLEDFAGVKTSVDEAIPALAPFTALEADTYRRNRFSTYFAKTALITVFIDNTERSPTFRLYPLDRAQDQQRKCWLQVWTEAANLTEAWHKFLGRPFRGLEDSFYREAFRQQVADPYLREAALRSLAHAGNDQESSYDFSFSSSNIALKGPAPGDLGVAVMADEEVEDMTRTGSAFSGFIALCRERQAKTVILTVGTREDAAAGKSTPLPDSSESLLVPVLLPGRPDPLGLRRQIALKMLLNAHSSALMAVLGRVVGNTMTNVSPSNLKLIGRATHLVLSHVNDVLAQPQWAAAGNVSEPLTFAEANAVLFDAMEYVRSREAGQTAEVALSIIRILEAYRRAGYVSWDEASNILEDEGLASYLVRLDPALCV